MNRLVAVLLLLLPAPLWALDFDQGFDDIPTAAEAMQVNAFADTANQKIDVIIDLLPEVYLYQHSLGLSLLDENGNQLEDFSGWQPPPGKAKHDEVFGDVEVYYSQLSFSVPLSRIPLVPTILEVRHQGCLEDVLCYTPQLAQIPLNFVPTAGSAAPSAGAKVAANSPTTADQPGFIDTLQSDNANSFSDWMGQHGLGMIVLLFFAGGLLLAFTPCVFPMIPILSGIIAGADQPTASRGFALSSAYVLGIALPYTLAGLLIALFGAGLNLQYMLQQPAAILLSMAVFFLLALAMFGLYELQLPGFLRQRLNALGEGRRGGSLLGAGILGAISALVVSPCVTPILAGALVYVAASGDAVTGASSLFALSLGMGTPLIIAGTGGAHLLPKAGAWMEDIKRFFGVMMLLIAIWLLDRIISDTITLALYGTVLTAYGVWLGALEPVHQDQSRLRRTVALILALYGAIMVVGAASGGSDPLQPLSRSATLMDSGTQGIASSASGSWLKISGAQTFQQQLDQARQAGRPVLVDFYADWCVACKILEERTLNHPDVLAALAADNHQLIKLDITEINAENQGIMQRYNIIGLPALVFFNRQGEEVAGSRVLGEMGPESFISHMNKRLTAANER